MDEMNLRVFAPYRKFYPSNARHVRDCDEMDELMAVLISRRRAELLELDTPPRDDILGLLLADTSASDSLIADQLKTMLLAGHETSSMMLTWALYLLGKHPACMARATAQVDALFEEAGPSPSKEQVKAGVPYLVQVLKEGMRLFAPVPSLTRRAVVNDTLPSGHAIPAGTLIAINMWTVHHSPDVWGSDVEVFRPERFGEAEARGRNPFAFLPFSVGSRNCVGQHLALLEGQVVLAHLLRWFSMTLIADHPPVESSGFMIPVRPEHGVFVKFSPRG